ncbi:hypothetical protein B0H13DRAFT_2452999 [Mycena leptocephala]|nr:hypothetical protein B0H13DRAFT_2452999 [Mycena leptocephala]
MLVMFRARPGLEARAWAWLEAAPTKGFRRVCNVEGNNWPDPTVTRTNPITHQTYPTPFFQFDVSDVRNEQIIKGVARFVATELENPRCWPSGLQHPRESSTKPWDNELFVDLAKASFRSLKRGWSHSNNSEAALKAEIQDPAHRHSQRRLHVQWCSKKVPSPLRLGSFLLNTPPLANWTSASLRDNARGLVKHPVHSEPMLLPTRA